MATWKKIIVSGSDAHLKSVTASAGIIVTGSSLFSGSMEIVTGNGTPGVTTGYQRIGLQSQTQLSGSFTGSFTGDGTNLTGVTATPTFPTTVKTDLASTDKFFVNDDAGNATSGNKQITYSSLLTDLAGTNLAVESSDSLTLASSITGISNFQSTSITGSSITGSFTGSFSGNFPSSGIISSSTLSSNSQGTVTSSINGINQNVSIGVRPQDSPTFTDLTLTGDINVNGGDIITNQTTFNIVPSTATTINVGTTDATAINFGKSGASTVTINDKLRVLGDLVVQGNVTELQVTNLNVEDQFVLLASGSQAVNVDGGIIVVSGSSAASGSALYHDTSARRWSFAQGVAASATSVTPNAYVGAIEEGSGTPSSAPALGDTGGTGTLYVQYNGDVWIYS